MTVPIVPGGGRGSIGKMYVEVHADTSPADREIDRDLNEIAKDADKSLEATGKEIGGRISDGMTSEFKRRGKRWGNTIEKATKNVVIQVRSTVRFDRIRDAIRRRFRRDVGESMVQEVGDAFDRASRQGGLFNRVGMTIADAVGAGFNVSGRSPLIAILIPALAALIGLIVAAVQAAGALVAVLYTVPGIIASIGLQVGVVAIAFQGIGEAVTAAFAAKNPKEMRKALKNLTPAARDFVKELLPLRELFRSIGRTVQQRFFASFEGTITRIRKALGPSLVAGFGAVAAAAGTFLRRFGDLLASPAFVNFFKKLIPATVRWLDAFGVSLFGKRGFITSILDMATFLIPFMEKVGQIVLRNLDTFAGIIFNLSSNPATREWLDHMAATLQLIFDLLFSVAGFLFTFLAELDKAGGQKVLEEVIHALSLISAFLSSPAGKKAMEGLVDLSIIGIKSFAGLVIAIFAVLAAFEILGEWIRVTFLPAVRDVFRFLGQQAVNFATFVGVWATRIVNAIGGAISWAVNRFKYLWNTAIGNAVGFMIAIRNVVNAVARFFRNLPGAIWNAISGIPGMLFRAGQNIVGSFINGIYSRYQDLINTLRNIVNVIDSFLPGSPAKRGPLSGSGYTRLRGQRMVEDFIKGIRDEIPRLREMSTTATSNIIFGSNSVQVNVAGDMDRRQAQQAGSAMGMSAANMIAARNTRLAVRTL